MAVFFIHMNDRKYSLRPNNSRLLTNDLTCASRYVERTRGFRSPPGGPTNLPRPFLIVNWWLPREPRRKLNGEPGKLRLAWKILNTASCHKMGNMTNAMTMKFTIQSMHFTWNQFYNNSWCSTLWTKSNF
jgi:hypothetical protein